jgi:hypothetical protein
VLNTLTPRSWRTVGDFKVSKRRSESHLKMTWGLEMAANGQGQALFWSTEGKRLQQFVEERRGN